MFINQEFETPEEALEHHGIKGMRWGVRRERTPQQRAETRRKIVKGAIIAGGVIAVAGGVALAVHTRNSSLAKEAAKSAPFGPKMRESVDKAFRMAAHQRTADAGRRATESFKPSVWKSPAKDLLSQMKANTDADARSWYQDLVKNNRNGMPLPSFEEYKQFLDS